MLIREFLWGNDLKAFLLLKSVIFAFPHERHLKPTTATTTWNSKQKPKSAIFCFFSHSFSEKSPPPQTSLREPCLRVVFFWIIPLRGIGRRRFLSTERSGGGCSARDKKKVMATKKDIQKNDRKGTGAGLAAGIELKNRTQQNEDTTQATAK